MKIVARAVLWNPEGLILMVRHKKDTPWVLPGGHIEAWETLHEGVIRELQEELNIEARFLDIDPGESLHHKGTKLIHLPLPITWYTLEYSDTNGKDKSRYEYVFLMETDDNIKEVQAMEIAEYKWFEIDDILEMKPNIETYDFIIEMLEKIVGDEE